MRGDWAQIARGNRIGYTGVKYLERISESSNYDSPVPGYTTQAVSIYVSPSTSAAVLATIALEHEGIGDRYRERFL